MPFDIVLANALSRPASRSSVKGVVDKMLLGTAVPCCGHKIDPAAIDDANIDRREHDVGNERPLANFPAANIASRSSMHRNLMLACCGWELTSALGRGLD